MGIRSETPGRACARWVLLGIAGLALLVPASAAAQGDGSAQPRIVGGTTASVSQYPWQAAVVYSPAKASGNAHQRQLCGGSLVTSRIVITAAHCVYDTDPDCVNNFNGQAPCLPNDPGGDGTTRLDPDDVDAVLGRTTLSDTSTGTEHGIVDTAYQGDFGGPAFNPSTVQNDIGYLVLNTQSGQGTIHIADASEGALWAPGVMVDISGWGSTSESGDTVDTLRKASVPIVADSTCVDDYNNDIPPAFVDPATMVCAGYQSGGVDTCFGDSGGPLESPVSGTYRLVGITSWGEGCAEPDFPGVYTRIAGDVLRPAAASTISGLEAANGLAHESVVGGSAPAATQAATPNPFAKCRKLKNKRKRKRCIKKVKRALAKA
jgi:trypsin